MFSRQKSHVVSVAVFIFVIMQCLHLLIKIDLLTMKLIEKHGDIYLDFNLSVTTLFIWQVRVIILFSIHKPISDRVSRLLLKIVQTDCRKTFRELNRRLWCLLPWCWVFYLFKVNSWWTFTDIKHYHIQLTSFCHSPDRASYLDFCTCPIGKQLNPVDGRVG